MDEIHNVSEGSIVEVTDISESNLSEIAGWLQEGVELEVRNIKESIRTSKITVTFSVTEGQGIPSYRSVVAATYESWPNGVSGGCHFDADGHTTNFGDKYFDVKEV